MQKFGKSKKIFYSVISCALVSLATIGFSSWIISIEDPEKKFDIHINVDALSFKTVICDISLENENETINLGPKDVSGSGIVSGNGEKEKLDIPLTGQLIVATEELNNIKSLDFSIASYLDGNQKVDHNLIESGEIGSDDVFGRSNTQNYYYLEPETKTIAKKDLTFTNYSVDGLQVDGFQVANLSLNGFSLKYSSYFEEKRPEEFYTEKLTALRNDFIGGSGGTTAEDYLSAIAQAKKEIDKMYDELKSLTIKISVTRYNGANL